MSSTQKVKSVSPNKRTLALARTQPHMKFKQVFLQVWQGHVNTLEQGHLIFCFPAGSHPPTWLQSVDLQQRLHVTPAIWHRLQANKLGTQRKINYIFFIFQSYVSCDKVQFALGQRRTWAGAETFCISLAKLSKSCNVNKNHSSSHCYFYSFHFIFD